MTYMINSAKFFMLHNIYCIFWTAWVFHRIRETVISYIISFAIVLIINLLGLDRLILFLFDDRSYRRFKGKEQNRIYEKLQK
jgi:hypothetical protein